MDNVELRIGKESLPLKGIEVLMVGGAIALPKCGRYLDDAGARVIKVESRSGDMARNLPPCVDGTSVYYASANCGTESLGLDLTKPEGRLILKQLIKQADVVMHNLPNPASVKKLGLSFDSLIKINPGIILVEFSAFGQTGPLARIERL